MNDLGHFVLALGWMMALLGMCAGAWGGHTRSDAWYRSARNASMMAAFCIGLSIFILGWGFYHDDYTNQYIWQHSNKGMDGLYKVAAIWGGMDGSMLLWCFMLSVSGAILAWKSVHSPRALMPWVIAVANSSLLFFTTIVLFFTNPFRFIKSPFIPPDGNGLNPLLQNPYMAIHPPMLYLGFTTFAIPFAFCMGALLSGKLSNEWIRLTRRWTLIAWGFLTVGIVLGGHWAYLELGWGGFWAWDPVENASFLPWLTGTAFLHSVMVQERKNMLKFWNVWLIVLTYALTVFGTYLTRSGIVQSVHAFASNEELGYTFLGYIAFVLVFAAVLSLMHRVELRSERRIEGLLSREAFFLLNNLVFLSIMFATAWGVMFPVLSEAITGTKQAVGIPFFNQVNVPLFLFLIFLMGIGPLIAWRKASFESLRRTFLTPLLFSCILPPILLWAGIMSFYPILSYSLCFFVLLTILGELYRGAKVQRAAIQDEASVLSGVPNLLKRHRSRYGGYLVHFGVLVVTVAITASMAHKIEREFSLKPGETFQIGRFSLTLEGLSEEKNENYQAVKAVTTLKATKTGETLEVLKPELRFYLRNKETTTEVALRMGAREDFYLVLGGLDDKTESASFKVFINPLQIWLWIGTLVMVAGTIVILIPRAGLATASADGRENAIASI